MQKYLNLIILFLKHKPISVNENDNIQDFKMIEYIKCILTHFSVNIHFYNKTKYCRCSTTNVY